MTATVLPVLADDGRIAAVRSLGLLDTAPEERFDRITALTARLLDAPVVLLSLVDGTRQWVKSSAGSGPREVPVEESLCAVAVQQDAPLLVEDLAASPRFRHLAVVRDGRRWYAGLPLHDSTGRAVATLCLLGDIPRRLTSDELDTFRSLAVWGEAELNATRLHERLDQLSAAEHQLLDVLDGAPAAVLLVEADATVSWGNDPAVHLFPAPIAGRPLAELLPSLDLCELTAQGRRSGDAGLSSTRRLAQVGLARGDRHFPAEVTGSVLPGSARRYVVFVRDLQSELSEHEELVALQERTGIVLDALAEGVFIVEADGRSAFCNLAAARMLRRRRGDVAGQDWHGSLHADGCATEPCPLADPLSLAGRHLSPVWVTRRDRPPLPVEISARMVRNGGGAASVVLTVADLTERLRVDRLKDEFVSSVSHELRTPLTSIRGSLGLLSAGVIAADSEPGRRMLAIAVQSTDRLRRLVDDILDLERLQAGQVELLIAPQKVGQLFTLAAQSVSGLAAAREVLLEVDDSSLWVDADADRIVQVLVNLLGNAIKFSPSGSTVRLNAAATGDGVRLAVEDQGRGIPTDQLERVFQRFAQVDGGDARDQNGSGLGLAIAQGLARQHGGSITVTSTYGVGSTFALELPKAHRGHRDTGAQS